MAAATPTTPTLQERLIEALSAKGLTVLDRGHFSIVKQGKTTLGYFGGKRAVRVESPRRVGKQFVKIEKLSEIERAVKFMMGFVPTTVTPEVAHKPPTKKPTKAK
jgi:hypothetical protein